MLLTISITFPFGIFIEKCNADDVLKHVLKEKVSCPSSFPDYVGNPLIIFLFHPGMTIYGSCALSFIVFLILLDLFLSRYLRGDPLCHPRIDDDENYDDEEYVADK